MNLKQKNDQIFATLLVWYLGLVIFAVALVHGLAAFYQAIPHQPIVGAYPAAKPCENFVFMSASMMMFIVASLVISGVARGHALCSARVVPGLIGLLTLMALYAFHAADFVTDLMNHHGYAFMVLAALIFGLIWHYDLKKSKHGRKRYLGWGCLFLVFMVATLAFRLLGIETITSEYSFSTDIPFYGLSQILAGKTALVDFPSMYGYFPVILEPFLQVFGLHSFFAMCGVYALLLFVGLFALFFVLNREIKHTSIWFFSALALLFIHTGSFKWATGNYNDPYYQYNPIRLFWPCLSVLLFYFYNKKPSLSKSMLFSVLAGVAIIWNEDTGMPIAVAFLAFLALQGLFVLTDRTSAWSSKKPMLKALFVKFVLHGILITVCIGLFFYLTLLVSGGPIHYDWLTKYQRLYYVLGFGMLPLPLELHPWMLVMALYLFGIVYAQFYWHRGGVNTRFANLILYLSCLGLGLFVYYSGRSDVDNLFSVLWPSLLISALLVDRLLRLVKTQRVTTALLMITVPFWIFILVASVNQLSLLPRLLKGDHDFFTHLTTPKEAMILSERNFINQNKGTHTSCLILAQRQGIYYLETRLSNPVVGPGIGELISLADQQHFLSQIVSHPVACMFFGMGARSAPIFLNIPLSALLPYYRVQAQNTEGTMLLLVPKA
jgi:hypothetical protein